MNSNSLALLDGILSPILKLIAFIIIKKNKLIRLSTSNNKVLVIKIMGAGNFVASNILNYDHITIYTSKSNASTISKFYPTAELIVLDTDSLFKLARSFLLTFQTLLFRKYEQVFNFEVHSSFAKLIASVPFSNSVIGLSVSNKSIFDFFFYDKYLVLSETPRADVINALIDTKKTIFSENITKKNFIKANNFEVLKRLNIGKKFKLIIAPTCAPVDNHRRVDISYWKVLLEEIGLEFAKIICIFANREDFQFKLFSDLSHRYSNLEVLVTNYDDMISEISSSDLVATVDSLALHISQRYEKPTIAFFGPSSPTSVSLGQNTVVISRSFICSPCTHLYFKKPCNNSATCRQFSIPDLRNTLQKLKG